MSGGTSTKNVFQELETHNPSVAKALRSFRKRSHASEPSTAYPQEKGAHLSRLLEQVPLSDELLKLLEQRHMRHIEDAYSVGSRDALPYLGAVVWPWVAIALLLIGIIAVGAVAGHAVLVFLTMHWQAILLPIGGVCVGAGAVLLALRIGNSPLLAIAPPDVESKDPLQELRSLAERTASRLRTAYSLQLWAVLIVGSIFIILIIWSMVMVSQQRLLYASAFGSGSVAMVILTQWKWQPFDRINEARKLADNADTIATGLRLRMAAISEIVDPSARAKAQWDAVREYLERSCS
jgi:hypothetical protein